LIALQCSPMLRYPRCTSLRWARPARVNPRPLSRGFFAPAKILCQTARWVMRPPKKLFTKTVCNVNQHAAFMSIGAAPTNGAAPIALDCLQIKRARLRSSRSHTIEGKRQSPYNRFDLGDKPPSSQENLTPMSMLDTKTKIEDSGLRYKSKVSGSPYATEATLGRTTMSCFLCGKHKPRSQMISRVLVGKSQNVCSSKCT